MDLRDYLRILRGQWRLIAFLTLIGIGVAAAVSFAATPVYEAKSQLFVSTPSSDDGGTLNQNGQFAQQRVKSYADIVSSPMVTERVVQQLGLQMSTQALAGKISAEAPIDTVLINVTVRDPSRTVAQRIANATAQAFTEVASEIERPEGSTNSPVKVSVVREAALPGAPVSPRSKLNLAMGLFLGVILGVSVAILRETLDTSIKGIDQVQDELSLATLGLIAHDSNASKRPLIVHDGPHSTRAEAFRQLRTNLQFADVDRPPRSIVLTSSLPQEGKSTTACNLAIALSQAGLRVALVEGDLRRPRLAAYMGLEGAIGLTNVLVGQYPLDDVLQPWGGSQLTVLASGPTPPNPSELLGSLQMQDLLRDLESRADLVLIDAPPLLPVTDAAVLANMTSGAIVVIRAGKTTRDQARRAVEILRGVDTHIYGAVLNMVPTRGPDAHRYAYYGYGYGPSRVDGASVGASEPPSRTREVDPNPEDSGTDA